MDRSLRAHLLAWLVLQLLLVMAINLAEAWLRATETATLVMDRLLLASARVIAEQVRDADGHIDAAIPPAALEMFASSHQDKVIYQVIGPSTIRSLRSKRPRQSRPGHKSQPCRSKGRYSPTSSSAWRTEKS